MSEGANEPVAVMILDREFLVLPEGFDAAAKVLDTPQLRPRALP